MDENSKKAGPLAKLEDKVETVIGHVVGRPIERIIDSALKEDSRGSPWPFLAGVFLLFAILGIPNC
jgi:hypothetical protein